MEVPPVLLYRLGNKIHKMGLPKVGKFITLLNRILFSTVIPSSATIGKNFRIGYLGLGTVIHFNAKIGDNCIIAQNVTIGRNIGDKAVPIIGNNVYIGTGSVVFGEITVGDNVLIGANSVVNRSVEPNKIIAGNPFKVIRENNIADYRG